MTRDWFTKALKTYLAVVLVLLGVALATVCIRKYVLHEKYPKDQLLFNPGARFTDFTGAAARLRHFGDPRMMTRRDYGGVGYEVYPYPYPTVLVHWLFYQSGNDLWVYLGCLVAFFVAVTVWFGVQLQRAGPGEWITGWVVGVTACTCFPLFYAIDRGNLEGFVWMLSLGGVYFLYREKYLLSATLIAAAASMKIFPALLMLLFIARREYRAFAWSAGAAVAMTILSWAAVGPTILQAALDSSASAKFLRDLYIVGFRPTEIGWDHSLMALVKQMLYVISRFRHISHRASELWFPVPGISTAVSVYGIAAPLGFVALYWLRLRKLPVLNQLMAFILLSVYLPFVSNEYTLLHMYTAWGAWLLFLYRDVRPGRASMPPRTISLMLVCFAVIFSCQSYWVIGEVDGMGGQIKAIAMMALLYSITATPMKSSAFGELAAS